MELLTELGVAEDWQEPSLETEPGREASGSGEEIPSVVWEGCDSLVNSGEVVWGRVRDPRAEMAHLELKYLRAFL